jgi:hypothetical protein
MLFPCHPNQCHYAAKLKKSALYKAVRAFTTVNSVHCRDINCYIKSQLNVLCIDFTLSLHPDMLRRTEHHLQGVHQLVKTLWCCP